MMAPPHRHCLSHLKSIVSKPDGLLWRSFVRFFQLLTQWEYNLLTSPTCEQPANKKPLRTGPPQQQKGASGRLTGTYTQGRKRDMAILLCFRPAPPFPE
ncbi:hypothetical protein VTK73DRAFT_3419 [Phialemonium thermophilum]|uniref:Uncharacterized protein n=1 Tax=Phialemonium thermophilum TaxID=223376 RepID=A0ABR3VJX5_9PEZI